MNSIQNKVFIVIVMMFLFLSIGYRLGDAFIPSIEIPEKSQLEKRKLQERPLFSWEEASEGAFQENAEQYVADSFPKRNDALLTRALAHRSMIELANVPFGYDVYPTFYGSKYLYCPSKNATMQTPLASSSKSVKGYKRGVSKLAAIMKEYEDINWSFYLVERSSISSQSPALPYISNAIEYQGMRDIAVKKLPDTCMVFDASCKNIDDYYSLYLSSDHHWRVNAAVRAYNQICTYYEVEPIQIHNYRRVFPKDFYGSNDRGGLCTKSSDEIVDVEYVRTMDISVIANGKNESLDALTQGSSAEGFKKSDRFDNVYEGYFHRDYGLIEITNPHESGTLLIIGDSFTNNLERFFAEKYNKVYVLDPRNYKGTLQAFLQEHDVDDAVFIGCTETLKNEDTLTTFSE